MLLEKKDFLKMVEPHRQNEIKKMRIKDLRQHFKLTHKINNEFIDATGKCFKCLKPLKPDYTQYEIGVWIVKWNLNIKNRKNF